MILPPTPFLAGIRILGSVLFIAGLVTFVGCAMQVYLGKIFKWGIADKGLYRIIRHPQYLALSIWGAGMCILWPRYIVLVCYSFMLVLYYFLGRDEERRMTAKYGDSYTEYKGKTGMFVPRIAGKWFSRLIPDSHLRTVISPMMAVAIVMLTGFSLRAITLRSLPMHTEGNLTLVSILPEDNQFSKKVLDGIVQAENSGSWNLLNPDKDYLCYMMPADYIMQGMIANTGSEFHLFKKHHTTAMITEWVLHPFQHLRSSPSLHMAKMHGVDPAIARRHHCPIGIDDPALQCDNCPYRRVILVEIDSSSQKHLSGRDMFSFNVHRTPICYIDINSLTGEIVKMKSVEKQPLGKTFLLRRFNELGISTMERIL